LAAAVVVAVFAVEQIAAVAEELLVR